MVSEMSSCIINGQEEMGWEQSYIRQLYKYLLVDGDEMIELKVDEKGNHCIRVKDNTRDDHIYTVDLMVD